MLREDIAYNGRFRMIVEEFGREIVIELNRGRAKVSDDEKTVTITDEDGATRKGRKKKKSK